MMRCANHVSNGTGLNWLGLLDLRLPLVFQIGLYQPKVALLIPDKKLDCFSLYVKHF